MLAGLVALVAAPAAWAAVYPLAESWSGQNFFNGWNPDPSSYDNTTNGDVFWGRPSTNTSMYYVNSAGRVIMKVDNTSFVPYNEKRYAPKLLSKTSYPIGTVWVLDAVHLPYGCSVWPAFWTQGRNWPAGGEIDIMEGINQQVGNQVAVHANGTCTATAIGTTTGTLGNANCAYSSGAVGCTYKDNNANSYGAPFAAAGGGVYVAELASTGISVWFLTRSSVPSSLTASATSIDTSTLGNPVASYSSSSCNISQWFTAQTMTLTTTLCGDWAGAEIAQTCGALVGTNTCYTTYVINDAAATYANAYFEINYVNVYSNTKSNATTTSGTSGTAASGSGAAQTSRAAGYKTWEGAGAGWAGAALLGLLGGVAMIL